MSLDELLLEDRKSRICQAVPLPYAKPMRTTMATKIFSNYFFIQENEPNMVCLEDPVTVVGDIHGQFFDLCRILEQDAGGEPN